jgi:cytoskeleton protein RodZ
VIKAGYKPYISTKDLLADSNLSVTLERLVSSTPIASSGKVQLVYRGSSWTRVRDASGKIIYEGQPKPGDRLEFTPPIEVRLGQPSLVSAVVGGVTRERLGGSSPITVKLP